MPTPTTTTTPHRERMSAADRREDVLVAALAEFAQNGYEGTSTEAIARRVGISQPYLFRLYRTKRELFIASTERCFEDTRLMFEAAAAGLQGEEALNAMGQAYVSSILADSVKLRGQLQAYVACSDPEICAVVQRGFGELVEFVESLAGVSRQQVAEFFSLGMLLNVLASTGALANGQPWAQRLLEGCKLMEHQVDLESHPG